MAALPVGATAPDIELPDMNGAHFSLRQALRSGPVVLAFFKISCPVCQFALPYVERIYQAANGKSVTVVGVSQNTQKDTSFFKKQYGLTLPIALDNPANYPVSNAYGLTNVPTLFYIAPSGEIEVSSVGWSKDAMETIARKVAEHAKMPELAVIKAGEDVPAFRAG